MSRPWDFFQKIHRHSTIHLIAEYPAKLCKRGSSIDDIKVWVAVISHMAGKSPLKSSRISRRISLPATFDYRRVFLLSTAKCISKYLVLNKYSQKCRQWNQNLVWDISMWLLEMIEAHFYPCLDVSNPSKIHVVWFKISQKYKHTLTSSWPKLFTRLSFFGGWIHHG